jgi:hypothetical protein
MEPGDAPQARHDENKNGASMFKGFSRRKAAIVLAAALLTLAAIPVGPAAASRDDDDRDRGACGRSRRVSLSVIGLTADQRLICFGEFNPAGASTIGQVSGLTGDASLVGIDFRPANNALYGVGNAGGVYTVNPDNAAATKVGQLSVALDGVSFGVDVNPAADALRVISNTGQNLRFVFATGVTATDTALTYPPSTAPAAGVTGAAYTNNDLDPNTGTTLYDLDSMLDQAAIQSPANSGQLVATGKLGVDTTPDIGFDIYSAVRDGTTVDVRGFASLKVGGQTRFYSIAIFTGKASPRGAFSPRNQVIGIAIPLNQR